MRFNFIVSFLFILSHLLPTSNHCSSACQGFACTLARHKSPLPHSKRGLETSSILRILPQIAVSYSPQLPFVGLLSAILPHDGCTSTLSVPGPQSCHLFAGLLSCCCSHAEYCSMLWSGRPSFGCTIHNFFSCLASKALCASHWSMCIKYAVVQYMI